MDELKSQIKKMIVERLFLSIRPDQIEDDAPLMETYNIDSVALFELVVGLEDDLGVAMKLVEAGCRVVMPWAAPIGSARGIINRNALKLLRQRLPDIALVVDAGLGAPSHAAEALELGYDAVLLNTAVAKAADPVAMANAFRLAVEAGRAGYESGLMDARDFASPSTPVVGTPFWHAVS